MQPLGGICLDTISMHVIIYLITLRLICSVHEALRAAGEADSALLATHQRRLPLTCSEQTARAIDKNIESYVETISFSVTE